jgi:hypothetical protein
MKQENEIREIIEQVRHSTIPAVECNEEAILLEYRSQAEEKSSLAIKIVTVFGGLFATSTFMGFIMAAGLYSSGVGLALFGIISIAGAVWLNIAYNKLIIDTISISVFITGFILIGIGLSDLDVDENIISILFFILGFLTLMLAQNYIISFVSVLIISGALLALIAESEQYNFIHVYVSVFAFAFTYWFLQEARIITRSRKISRLYNPVRMGLVFSFLGGLILVGKKGIIPIAQDYVWVSSVVTIAAVMYVISILFAIFKTSSSEKAIIYALSFILLLSTVMSPSISGSILIILVCFLVNHKTGFVAGIIGLIYFISQYYYDLGLTLLVKSILLFSTGILFSLICLFTYRKLKTND